MRKRLAVMLMICCMLLSGCKADSAQASPAPYTVGVLLKSMNNQHWMDLRTGIQDAARAAGVQTVILYPRAESAVKEQQSMFYDLLRRKPDVILFAPCDSTDCAPLIAAADEAGIPVIALDTRAIDVRIPYVGANNEHIGKLAARRLASLMDGTGKVVVMSGVLNQASHMGMVAGFKRELSRYPGMELVSVVNADGEFVLAIELTKQIMEQEPETRGIFCTSAVMGLGVFEQKKRGFYAADPYIVAVDTQDDALSALQAAGIHGLITQDGYETGYKGLRLSLELLENGSIADSTYIKSEPLDRYTVDDYIEARKNGREGE